MPDSFSLCRRPQCFLLIHFLCLTSLFFAQGCFEKRQGDCEAISKGCCEGVFENGTVVSYWQGEDNVAGDRGLFVSIFNRDALDFDVEIEGDAGIVDVYNAAMSGDVNERLNGLRERYPLYIKIGGFSWERKDEGARKVFFIKERYFFEFNFIIKLGNENIFLEYPFERMAIEESRILEPQALDKFQRPPTIVPKTRTSGGLIRGVNEIVRPVDGGECQPKAGHETVSD